LIQRYIKKEKGGLHMNEWKIEIQEISFAACMMNVGS